MLSLLKNLIRLDRALEFIPSDQELLNRRAENSALTRPELAFVNC